MTKTSDLQSLIGTEIGVSKWILVDQARIDAFAEITEDRQFIHIDPEAARATPFGGTIAHGFLTLSLASAMSYDAVKPLRTRSISRSQTANLPDLPPTRRLARRRPRVPGRHPSTCQRLVS